jgi:hypothetical protein
MKLAFALKSATRRELMKSKNADSEKQRIEMMKAGRG